LVLQDPAVILPDIESKTSSLRAMDKNYMHAGASTARSYFLKQLQKGSFAAVCPSKKFQLLMYRGCFLSCQ
jgi:hypothetical protein